MLNLEDLRRAGVSRSPVRWVTNPIRNLFFRLALPYFEVIARTMHRLEPPHPSPVLPSPALVPAVSEGEIAAAVVRVRDEALAGVRAEVRQELAGARAEMRAMSYRFTSIEEMLNTTSRWLAGTERHLSEVSEESRSQFQRLQERIETAERGALAASSNAAPSSPAGPGLLLASGPFGRFLVRHPDVVGDAIIRGEFWDAYLKDAIEASADPERGAIDAGAYIGFHSVFLSRHFARVHAFEPQSQAYGLLRANVELNGCRNVQAVEAGLYSHSCWLRLAPDPMQEIPIPRTEGAIDYDAIGNAAALTFIEADEPASDAVRAVTIDSLALDRVGFIKIDTQGADFHVLQGAVETIRRCRPVIAFEFERDLSGAHGTASDAFEPFFRALGYQLTEARRTPDGKQADYLARPV